MKKIIQGFKENKRVYMMYAALYALGYVMKLPSLKKMVMISLVLTFAYKSANKTNQLVADALDALTLFLASLIISDDLPRIKGTEMLDFDGIPSTQTKGSMLTSSMIILTLYSMLPLFKGASIMNLGFSDSKRIALPLND